MRPGFFPYPKWIHAHEAIDGIKRIVKTREEHELAIGKQVNEDGTVVVDVDPDGPEDHSKPPSIELILSRGYTQEAAEKIHAEEQEKFDKGYPPYGTNQPPPSDAAHEPTQAEREAVFAEEPKIQAGQTEGPELISKIEKTGINYTDLDGKTIAFLPYDTLELAVSDKDSVLLPMVNEAAAKVQAKRGQEFDLGGAYGVIVLGQVAAPEEKQAAEPVAAPAGDSW